MYNKVQIPTHGLSTGETHVVTVIILENVHNKQSSNLRGDVVSYSANTLGKHTHPTIGK